MGEVKVEWVYVPYKLRLIKDTKSISNLKVGGNWIFEVFFMSLVPNILL